VYGQPLLYPAEALKRLKFYTIPKTRRLRETVAALARELEGFVYSDETLKTKWKKEDHPRGQPDNPGQFVENPNSKEGKPKKRSSPSPLDTNKVN
jgi:hypothetical protein